MAIVLLLKVGPTKTLAKRKILEADLRLLSQRLLQLRSKRTQLQQLKRVTLSFFKFSETKLSLVVQGVSWVLVVFSKFSTMTTARI